LCAGEVVAAGAPHLLLLALLQALLELQLVCWR
jgi:hypothetical protein